MAASLACTSLLLAFQPAQVLISDAGRANAPRPAVRVPAACMAKAIGPKVELLDDEGDTIRFAVTPSGVMQMFDRGELLCDGVNSISFSMPDGQVSVDAENVDADFSIVWAEQRESLAKLALLASESRVGWLGDEPVPLPTQIADLLVDDELKASRPGVRILWLELLKVYPTEEAALAAVQRNSAIVLPYLNRPNFIPGNWKVLKGMMSEQEALEVITKNPGVLASNPAGLTLANANVVKNAARAVDATEGFLESIGWTGLPSSGIK